MTFDFRDYIPHTIAAIGAGVAIISLSQSSELSVADYAERIRANEKSVEANEKQITVAASELKVLATRLGNMSPSEDLGAVNTQIAEIVARLGDIEARPVATGSVSAEAVAAILARDYADELRGPVGPKGETGAQGPAGPAGAGTGTTLDPRAPIVIDASFTSDYEVKRWGSKTEVKLLGCSGGGGTVACDFLATNVGNETYKFTVRSEETKIALPSGVLVYGDNTTMNGSTSNWGRSSSMIPGVPIRFSVEYQTGSETPTGLLALQLGTDGGNNVLWREIAVVQ